MAVYTRPDSPFYWVSLEAAAGRQRRRLNTKIPIGSTLADRRDNRALAEAVYSATMGDIARGLICGQDRLAGLTNVVELSRDEDHGTYIRFDTKTGIVKVPVSTRLRQALDALPVSPGSFTSAAAGPSSAACLAT